MIHRYVHDNPDRDDHWAAGTNGLGGVLLQLQDDRANQVRVLLSPEQAEEIAIELTSLAGQARWTAKELAKRDRKNTEGGQSEGNEPEKK